MPLFTKQKQSPFKPVENQISLRSLTAPAVTPPSVFMQENIQKGKHKLILIGETLPQLQPLLLLSDLVLSLHQKCDNSGRGVTEVAAFSPLVLLPLPLLFRGLGGRPGSQPTSLYFTISL